MVVAGMLDTHMELPVIEYKVTAHQNSGDYGLSGVGATTIETVDTFIDLVPSFNISQYNYMERLWAYLSVRSLLRKVERGQLYSCQPQPQPEFSYQVRRWLLFLTLSCPRSPAECPVYKVLKSLISIAEMFLRSGPG